MEYKDIKPLIESIPDFGWMSSERQREYMFNLGKVTTCAAEIGTYKGLSAAIVGLGMKNSEDNTIDRTYYCIDSFESSNVELDGRNTWDCFLSNMAIIGLYVSTEIIINKGGYTLTHNQPTVEEPKSGIKPIIGFSYQEIIPKCISVGPILDWIYIDGSHETPDVLQDIELYHPKVKEGGLLLFHDHTWTSVRKAVDIAVRKNLIEVVEIFDDFGVYKKVNN